MNREPFLAQVGTLCGGKGIFHGLSSWAVSSVRANVLFIFHPSKPVLPPVFVGEGNSFFGG
jgi:hypothetical protein